MNLADSLLTEAHSDLKESLEGLSPVYAKIIFARRMEIGFSQKELSEQAGIGLKAVSRAEGGFDNLSTETYDKIFRALDLRIRDVAEAMIQLDAAADEQAATTL